MENRREFIKKAALLSGGTGLAGMLPESVLRAMAINPAPGSTYLDAEHIVILMQENRSFDHCYGTLRGVRGFNDPRVIKQPDNNVAWLQKNAAGETYVPFRLNIRETKSTWLGSLPHSWTNQVDAGNAGKHDKWLLAKPSGHKGFEKTPLTMGYYNREDIPFYYALADAFTVCDQNFCSSLTGTTPNRLYLWTGTVKPAPTAEAHAYVRNEDLDYDKEAGWTGFPERLEQNNISWKIYQNEISLPSGLEGEEDAWLANFTDNPIEWFSQYNVRFSGSYRAHISKMVKLLPAEIAALESKLAAAAGAVSEMEELKKSIEQKKSWLQKATADIEKYTDENFEKLSAYEKNLHAKAFCTNIKDPHYRSLDTLHYKDGDTERTMKVPKGDVLHQFREDVNSGSLPTVSWVVGPENFSDHPGAPWYGAWYVSEVMDILTRKPEVWKKTIFILCYDENDGYFDHVPPFLAPNPHEKNSGLVSAGIDTSVEFVTLEQDMKRHDKAHARESAIGLGYRVPLVIASPWSRGGAVCSQVFDHTSILRFMEHFLQQKFGKQIEESNITRWRRTVCGDLTAVFKPYNGGKPATLSFPAKDAFYEGVHKAQFKKDPAGYKALTAAEIAGVNQRLSGADVMPKQERGIRPSCPLPYQLYADGNFDADKQSFAIRFRAANEVFGKKTAGAPFSVYGTEADGLKIRSYAVSAGDTLTDEWKADAFSAGKYQLSVNGPNGFLREFMGSKEDPLLQVQLEYSRLSAGAVRLSGNVDIVAVNTGARAYTLEITDNAYKTSSRTLPVKAKEKRVVMLDLSKSFGWYDFTVRVAGHPEFEKRYAGHVETGKESFTDPLMGQVG